MPVKSAARDFFLHLLSTVLLYMSVVSFTILVFQIINNYIPDVLEHTYYGSRGDRIRFPLAMLVVAFPVYIWSVWYIKKLIRKEPEIKELKVRKWLMYLTVFAAALIIVITLISVVYNFLNGEFTVRFLLKILTVLFVSLCVFWYYLIEVRDDQKRKIVQTVIMRAAPVVVIAAVVVGFLVMGSPGEQRARRLDEDRLSDLQNLYWTANRYFNEKKALPSDMEQLRQFMTRDGYTDLSMAAQDPTTGESYTYELTGTSTFKLCATFALANTAEQAQYYSLPARPHGEPKWYTWEHTAGYYCFDREAALDEPVPVKD